MRCVNCRFLCSPRRVRNVFILSLTAAVVMTYIQISTNEEPHPIIVITKNTSRSHDLSQIYTKLRTKVPCPTKLRLLILVSSNLGHSDRRYLIRKTWGPDNSLLIRWRTVFLLTENDNNLEKRRSQIESDLYGDLITGNYKESFYNMAFKVAMGFEWALKFCKFDYLLKTDDDIFVNTHGLLNYLNLKSTLKTKLYTGNPMVGSVVLRRGRYAVKYAGKEIRDDATNKTIFEPYCSGGGFLLSNDVVSSLLDLYDLNYPLNIDDAYIGELALRAGVKPLINPKNFKMYEVKCRYDPIAFVQHPAKGDCLLELHRKHAKYLLTGEMETPKPTPPPTKPPPPPPRPTPPPAPKPQHLQKQATTMKTPKPTPQPTKPPPPRPRLTPPPAPTPQHEQEQATKKTTTILRNQNPRSTKTIIERKPTLAPRDTPQQNPKDVKSSDEVPGVNPTLALNAHGLKPSEKISRTIPIRDPQHLQRPNSQGLKSSEKIRHRPTPALSSQGLNSPEKIPGTNAATAPQYLSEQNSQGLKS